MQSGGPLGLTSSKSRLRAVSMPSQAGSTMRICVHAKIQGMARRVSTPPPCRSPVLEHTHHDGRHGMLLPGPTPASSRPRREQLAQVPEPSSIFTHSEVSL